MVVKINPDVCIGCGLCANSCPEVFKMGDDKAVPVSETVAPGQEDCAKQAAEDCPVSAISIE